MHARIHEYMFFFCLSACLRVTVLCSKVANACQSSGSAERSFLVASKGKAVNEPGFGITA